MPTRNSHRPATRRRETCYPRQHSVCLSPEVDDQIETLCDLHETARSVMLRRVIERRLPIVESTLASECKRTAKRAAKSAEGSA